MQCGWGNERTPRRRRRPNGTRLDFATTPALVRPLLVQRKVRTQIGAAITLNALSGVAIAQSGLTFSEAAGSIWNLPAVLSMGDVTAINKSETCIRTDIKSTIEVFCGNTLLIA